MIPSPPDTRASLILRLPDAANVKAWDDFVSLYGPAVFRLAKQRGLQAVDAEDLVQDVFIAVARSVEQWLERNNRGSFRAWLLTIARNKAINLLTRANRIQGLGGDSGADIMAGIPVDAAGVSSLLDFEIRRELFQRAAEIVRDSVADITWQCFWLTHVDEIPIAEVSRQLGVSVGNVYIARSRVMTRLRNAVKRFEVTE